MIIDRLSLLTPGTLYRQAVQIANWNAGIVSVIPKVPEILEDRDDIKGYLYGRKHVFNDFRLAAEKVASAIRQSGILLLFQLQPEVRRLEWLTLHEVEELLYFVHELAERIPETEVVFDELRKTLEQIEQEMKSSRRGCEWGSETGAESSSFGISQTERNG